MTVILIFASTRVEAQWFGPKNYEECMLEKMKGQTPNMGGMARAACLKIFPEERVLSEEEVPATWCETTYDTITACAKPKSGIKITKAAATFSRSNCEIANLSTNLFSGDQAAEAKLPMFGSTFRYEVKNAQQYKCGRFIFYGYIKE